MPEWAQALFDSISSAIEFKGLAYVEASYSTPGDTDWGVNLLEIAPALMEIEGAGLNDGEQVFGIIHRFGDIVHD